MSKVKALVKAAMLLAATTSINVAADTVGATSSETAEPMLALAFVDSGANDKDWSISLEDFPVTSAQHKRVTEAAEAMNAQVVQRLYIELFKKLEEDI